MYPNQPQPGGQPLPPTQPQQPQQPPQPQPLSDPSQFNPTYLDEIAAPVPQKTVSPLLLWGMIGGVLLALVVFVIALTSSGAPSSTERMANTLYRVQALKEVASDNATNIKDSRLRAANGSLGAILSGAESDFIPQLSPDGKAPKAPKDSPITAEFTTLSGELDDARLNERFDTVYAREISYQIRTIRSDLAIIYKAVRADDFKKTLSGHDTSLKDLDSDFSTFNVK